eukprot:6194073-Pleurochrysis_carterae.AAC.1
MRFSIIIAAPEKSKLPNTRDYEAAKVASYACNRQSFRLNYTQVTRPYSAAKVCPVAEPINFSSWSLRNLRACVSYLLSVSVEVVCVCVSVLANALLTRKLATHRRRKARVGAKRRASAKKGARRCKGA